jgi:protein SPA2
MLALQKELDNVHEDSQRARDREVRRSQQDEEELQILRERCERLEEERTSAVCSVSSPTLMHLTRLQADSEVVEQLRADMEALIAEVSDLSRRNDKLMTSKDSDFIVIRDLDAQLKDHKRKYEQAKTELRSVKGRYAHPSPFLRFLLTFRLQPHRPLFRKNPSLTISYRSRQLVRFRTCISRPS